MPVEKSENVEKKPKVAPEKIAAAAAQIPAVAVNVEPSEETAAPAAKETRAEPETSFDLKRAVEHEGVTYKRIEIDRARLTGEATTKAERLFLIECPRYPDIANRLDSMVFWQILGAIAAGMPYAAVKKMDMADAWRLAGDTKEFFFGS